MIAKGSFTTKNQDINHLYQSTAIHSILYSDLSQEAAKPGG